MQSRQKNCGIKKTDYKNCASRWLLTQCNTMHGTKNVKKNPSFTFAFPFTSIYMKRKGLYEYQLGHFNVKSFFFCRVLTGMNALKCSTHFIHTRRSSYSGEDRLPQSTWRADAPWVRRAPRRMED